MSNARFILWVVRDDLHKGAAVPRRYRELIRECAKKKPGGARACELATKAVAAELAGEISGPFVARLSRWLGELRLEEPTVDALGARHPLERRVVEHLQRAALSPHDGDPVVRACIDAVAERVRSHERAIDAHIAVKDAVLRSEVVPRVTGFLGSVNIAALVAELMRGARPEVGPAGSQVVTLEEDLR